MGSIRVNQNVFQAVTQATNDTTLGGLLGKPDISAAEMAKIEEAIGADGKVDAEEQKLLDALKNHSSFTLTNGTEKATIDPKSVSFPTRSVVEASQNHLETIIRYGNGNQAQLGAVAKETYATQAEAIQAARGKQSYSPVDSDDYAVVRKGNNFGIAPIQTKNALSDISAGDLAGARMTGPGARNVVALVADSGDVRHTDALPHWKPSSEMKTVADVKDRLNAMLTTLGDRGDHRATFPAVYLATTNKAEKVLAAIRDPANPDHNKYKNLDPKLVENIVMEFGKMYFDAFDNYEKGNVKAVPPAWKAAFDEAKTETTSVMEDMLLGINAHIGNDLGMILAKTMPDGKTLYDPKDPKQVATFNAFNQILIDETPTILANVTALEGKLGGISARGMSAAKGLGDYVIGGNNVEAITKQAFTMARADAESSAKALMAGTTTRTQVEQKIGSRAEVIRNMPNSGRQYIGP